MTSILMVFMLYVMLDVRRHVTGQQHLVSRWEIVTVIGATVAIWLLNVWLMLSMMGS